MDKVNFDILQYCDDFYGWPRSWMGIDEDLENGEQIVKVFEPFVVYLINSGLSKKTIREHTMNLWLLGGEIIRSLHWDESLRRLSGTELVSRVVGDDGGPYSRHISTEDEQRAFDATCRKLHRFMHPK